MVLLFGLRFLILGLGLVALLLLAASLLLLTLLTVATFVLMALLRIVFPAFALLIFALVASLALLAFLLVAFAARVGARIVLGLFGFGFFLLSCSLTLGGGRLLLACFHFLFDLGQPGGAADTRPVLALFNGLVNLSHHAFGFFWTDRLEFGNLFLFAATFGFGGCASVCAGVLDSFSTLDLVGLPCQGSLTGVCPRCWGDLGSRAHRVLLAERKLELLGEFLDRVHARGGCGGVRLGSTFGGRGHDRALNRARWGLRLCLRGLFFFRLFFFDRIGFV